MYLDSGCNDGGGRHEIMVHTESGKLIGEPRCARYGIISFRSDSATDASITVWVCVAALAILDRLDAIDQETLAWWLSERQVPSGGLNGRPEKLEDVRNNHIYSRSFATYQVR